MSVADSDNGDGGRPESVGLGDRERETLIRDLHDGTIAAKWQIPQDIREALRFRAGIKRRSRARELEKIVERTGRLPLDDSPSET